ncbi:MAG: hypothetical protein PW786_01375 [Arachidicoccus sp.]|nr:hypothetical protein [Arachidicoccus sp.]
MQRDLLILTKVLEPDMEFVERQIRNISSLLVYVESVEAFCIANEIIDINNYRIINAPYLIRKIVADGDNPFVFFFNKN